MTNILNLFLILILFLPSVVMSNPAILSLNHFSKLTEQEKEDFIVKIMELMVEIDSKHEKDQRQTFKRFDGSESQFSFDYKRLRTFFEMNAAYAQSQISNPEADKLWKETASKFISLVDDSSKKNKCLFAGWISQTSKDSKYCVHPKFYGKEISKAYVTPQKGGGCDINDRSKIQCNPVIFGFKSIAKKSLFCVPSTSGAHNSSYDCMKAALGEDSKNKGDDRETRLNYIKQQLEKPENSEIFKSIQEFIYKTCVCEDETANGFSKSYHKYMRPHRTCYGLMKMIGETGLCTDDKIKTLDLTFFKKLNSFILEKNIKNITDQKKIDSLYKQFLTTFKNEHTSDYDRLCKGPTPGPTPTPEPPKPEPGPGPTPTPEPPKPEPGPGPTPTPEPPKPEPGPGPTPTPEPPKPGPGPTPTPEPPKPEPGPTPTPNPEPQPDPEPQPETEELPQLEVTGDKKTELYEVKAVITNGEGWRFIWVLKNTGKLKVKKGWETTTSSSNSSNSGLADDGSLSNTPTTASNTPLTIIQLRYETNYDVCGELSKEGKETIQKCITILKKDSPKTRPPYTPPSGPPPPPIRRSGDTSAGGVL